jgi:hypothetical protein
MRNIRNMLLLGVVLLLQAPFAHAQLGTSTVTSNLNVTVGAESALTIQSANTNFSSPTLFNNYTATTNFTYFVRTTKSGGSGSITLEVTTDFSPAGGPSVASPPTTGDKLTYNCTVPAASSGTVTPCSGPVQASTTSPTNVATFGQDTRSPLPGVASSVAWTLTNDSLYQTGSYAGVVTFTISAS